MSINIIPTWQVQQYANTINLLLQQRGSKLRNTVTVGNYVGKQASPVDQLGAVNMQPVTTKFGPMGRIDAPTDRRWVFPLDFDLPQLIDTLDLLRIKLDPKSDYTQNALHAAGRQLDDLIIDNLFADAKTGETGGTTTTFLAGNIVAVNFGAAGNTGLTVAKMREAKRILMAHEVDFEAEEPTMIVKAKQHDNLLAEAQVISTDFNEKPVMVDGKVTRFLGINIKHCERLDANGSSQDLIPVYVKSGMHLGIWNDISTNIAQRVDLQNIPWQVYVTLTAGATRIEEKKVVQIVCA